MRWIKKGGKLNKYWMFFLILILLILIPQNSYAGRFIAGGGAGFVMSNGNAEGGFSYNGYVIYQMDNVFSFMTSAGRYSAETIYKRLSQGGYSRLSEGDYTLVWIEESVILRKERERV